MTRKIKALDVVLAIDLSGSMRREAGEDGTGETIRFGDSSDCIPDTPARWSPTARKSPIFGTSYPVFNRGGFQLVRCPLWVKSGHFSYPSVMSAFGGKADVNHQTPECPLIAISGRSDSTWPFTPLDVESSRRQRRLWEI